MDKSPVLQLQVDEQGRLTLPRELANRLGLHPGATVRVEEQANGLSISRSSGSLARIYIEPTNTCNLDCRTCIRNVWDEPLGHITAATFESIISGLSTFSPTPQVFFGGFGEPLAHPKIVEMVAAARKAGAQVELITNGILLHEALIRSFIEVGLHRLWVSLDGATPESYSDVRLGAELPRVLHNLGLFQNLRGRRDTPHLGIAYVAMKRNIHELASVIRLGENLGADQFSISNLLPHTLDMSAETLYQVSQYNYEPLPAAWSPLISLPRLDINDLTQLPLLEALKGHHLFNVAGQTINWGSNHCPFIEKGSLSIRWDGQVSPCLSLLHSNQNYLENTLRKSEAYFVGNIKQQDLHEIWNQPDYIALRQRLLAFDFSPCSFCNSCSMAESNLKDCYGNMAPACGGCLWAQGLIQCP